MRSIENEAEIVKQDAAGRVRISRERREELVDEFEGSALSGAQFARLAGIKYSTFASWVDRRRSRRGAAPEQSAPPEKGGESGIRLFEAVVERGGPERGRAGMGAGLIVELPGGSRLKLDGPGQLACAAELVVLIAQGGRGRC